MHFLFLRNQQLFFQFYRKDDEGFQRQKIHSSPIQSWLQHGETTEDKLCSVDALQKVHVDFMSLETQRRMHPSIAQLVRETLYPSLEDAQSVLEYPEIDGMRKRLFWLDHRHHQGDTARCHDRQLPGRRGKGRGDIPGTKQRPEPMRIPSHVQ